MYKFEAGMKVIVYRVKPIFPKEYTFNDCYPQIGWKGTLVQPTGIGEGINGWNIFWDKDCKTLELYPSALDENCTMPINEWMIIPFIPNQTFKRKDKVIYISNVHKDSSSNPLWGGLFRKTIGIVKRVRNQRIKVRWYVLNKRIINYYNPEDLLNLELLVNTKRNIKNEIENLCVRLYKQQAT